MLQWIPWGGFILLFIAGLALLAYATNTVNTLDPTLVRPRGSPAAAEFASATFRWAGAMIGVIVALAAALAVSLAIHWEMCSALHIPRQRTHRIVAWTITGVFLAGLLVSLLAPQSDLTSLRDAQGSSVVGWPIEWITSVSNGLLIAAIASLFAASSAVLHVAVDTDPKNPVAGAIFDSLQRRMTWLLWLGAGATAFGVLEITALHSLAAYALDPSPRAPTPPTRESVIDVAVHMASFCGIVFTLALAAMYLPTSIVIQFRKPEPPATPVAATPAAPRFTPDPPSRSERLKEALGPMLRLLAALAPLLVGQFSDFILKLASN